MAALRAHTRFKFQVRTSDYTRFIFSKLRLSCIRAPTSLSVKKEDKLEGSSNFHVWKIRVMNILQENELSHFVNSESVEPTSTTGQATFLRNQAKAKRIIFDSVKDNIMSVMTSLMTPKQCMDALTQLYEKSATNQKRTLKHKLKYLKMEKGESVGTFCSKIAQIRDQLRVLNIKVDDDDLVQVIYDGLPASWGTFLFGVIGRTSEPSFKQLWHDCLEEESGMMTREDTSREHHALATKTRRRGRRPSSQRSTQESSHKDNPKFAYRGKSFDMSKVKCFNCNRIEFLLKTADPKKEAPIRKGSNVLL